MFSKNKDKKRVGTEKEHSSMNKENVGFVDPARIRTMADDVAEARGESPSKKEAFLHSSHSENSSDFSQTEEESSESPFLSGNDSLASIVEKDFTTRTSELKGDKATITFDEEEGELPMSHDDKEVVFQKEEASSGAVFPNTFSRSEVHAKETIPKDVSGESVSQNIPSLSQSEFEGDSAQENYTVPSHDTVPTMDSREHTAKSVVPIVMQSEGDTVKKDIQSDVASHSVKTRSVGLFVTISVVFFGVLVAGGVGYAWWMGWFSPRVAEEKEEIPIPLEVENPKEDTQKKDLYQPNTINNSIIQNTVAEEIESMRSALMDAPEGEVYGFRLLSISGESLLLSEAFPKLSETLGMYVQVSQWFIVATTESYGVRFGVVVGIDDVARARNNLRNGESIGGEMIRPLYPNTLSLDVSYVFSNSTHEATAIRYLNFEGENDPYSIDYATTTDGFLVMGTSRLSTRRILDTLDIFRTIAPENKALEITGVDIEEDFE